MYACIRSKYICMRVRICAVRMRVCACVHSRTRVIGLIGGQIFSVGDLAQLDHEALDEMGVRCGRARLTPSPARPPPPPPNLLSSPFLPCSARCDRKVQRGAIATLPLFARYLRSRRLAIISVPLAYPTEETGVVEFI
jgi:hypothetical protein